MFSPQKRNVFVSESTSQSNPQQESSWASLLDRFGVDRAVAFAVMSRGWQVLTGPITQLLIMFCMTAVQTGYYTTFLNLLAMQVFAELGLHVVLINVASHEWINLSYTNNKIQGDTQAFRRLAALWKGSVRWYSIAAILFFLSVAGFGLMFFQNFGDTESGQLSPSVWLPPWLVLVALTCGQLLLLPATSLLEGCGQLPVLNRFRFWQAVAGSLAVWAALAGGLGLWALCCSAAVRLVGETWLVRVHFRDFFRFLSLEAESEPDEESSNLWKEEVRPLQWRMAIQGALLWFAGHLAGLVLFDTHGAEEAGRYGMMLTIMTAIQAASLAWIETRRPLFGNLIAGRRFQELDTLFFRMSRFAIGLLVVGVTFFCIGIEVASRLPYWFFERISERLPDTTEAAIYGMGLVAMQFAQCTNLYVRAHKRDPFLVAAIVSNLAIAGLVFYLGRSYGIRGVVAGYTLGVVLIQTPLWVGIWAFTRSRWHQNSEFREAGS